MTEDQQEFARITVDAAFKATTSAWIAGITLGVLIGLAFGWLVFGEVRGRRYRRLAARIAQLEPETTDVDDHELVDDETTPVVIRATRGRAML